MRFLQMGFCAIAFSVASGTALGCCTMMSYDGAVERSYKQSNLVLRADCTADGKTFNEGNGIAREEAQCRTVQTIKGAFPSSFVLRADELSIPGSLFKTTVMLQHPPKPLQFVLFLQVKEPSKEGVVVYYDLLEDDKLAAIQVADGIPSLADGAFPLYRAGDGKPLSRDKPIVVEDFVYSLKRIR